MISKLIPVESQIKNTGCCTDGHTGEVVRAVASHQEGHRFASRPFSVEFA